MDSGLMYPVFWNQDQEPITHEFKSFDRFYDAMLQCPIVVISTLYEGPAKSFVTGFGLLQSYVLSNIFLLQTLKYSPFTETQFCNLFYPVTKSR